MDEYTAQLIQDACLTYKAVVAGKDSRITRGKVLWDLFESAAEACRADAKSGERQLAERINELAVAKFLAEDKGLQSSITYEPELLPDGRKIDFVADRGRDNAYIEVKTVHPDIADNEAAWENYLKRRKLHPQNVIKKTRAESAKIDPQFIRARGNFINRGPAFLARAQPLVRVASNFHRPTQSLYNRGPKRYFKYHLQAVVRSKSRRSLSAC